jgi:hypothetical protein
MIFNKVHVQFRIQIRIHNLELRIRIHNTAIHDDMITFYDNMIVS